jgi:hypothetical protein
MGNAKALVELRHEKNIDPDCPASGATMEMQAKFVLIGAHELQHAPAPTDTWCALQTILVSAANLSKLFWGSSGKRAAERKPLRDSFGITDRSPLKDPDMRNDFEHFDERIWKHFVDEDNNVYSGRNIEPLGILEIPGTSHFGLYDPKTGKVTFWDREASIPEIVEEAKRIVPPDDLRKWEAAMSA